MLPANELLILQAVVNGAMDQTVKIDRPAITAGTYGEAVETYSTLAAACPCLIGTATAAQMQRFGLLLGEQVAWHLLLPQNTNIQRNDRLTLQSGDVARVQGVMQPQSYSVNAEVIATEVR